jgi:hypothetical protein
MENEGMELEIIINDKTTDDGQAIIQVRLTAYALKAHTWNADRSLTPARDRRGRCDQAFQERTRDQRPALALPAGQVLLGPATHQERHLLAPARPPDHQPEQDVRDDAGHQARRPLQEDCSVPETVQEDPQDHRAGPFDRHRGRILWAQRYAPRHSYRYVLGQIHPLTVVYFRYNSCDCLL